MRSRAIRGTGTCTLSSGTMLTFCTETSVVFERLRHWPRLKLQRNAIGKAERLLKQQRCAEQFCIAVRPSYELEPDRQAVLVQTAGQRYSWTADKRDDECQEHPIDVSGQFFTCNFGRESLLDSEGRHRNCRAYKEVVIIEELRHAME